MAAVSVKRSIPLLSRPFQVFQDHRFSCYFKRIQKLSLFWGIFGPFKKSSADSNSGAPKCVPIALWLCNYSYLSYIVLALSTAVTNLSNKTLIFSYDFRGPTIKFHDFPGLDEWNSWFSMTFANPVGEGMGILRSYSVWRSVNFTIHAML